MYNTAKRFVLGLFLSVPLAALAGAAQYQCNNTSGCSARVVAGGQQYEFTFSQGDTLDTSAGWIVNTSDGWAPV